jgi:hypothetical protein
VRAHGVLGCVREMHEPDRRSAAPAPGGPPVFSPALSSSFMAIPGKGSRCRAPFGVRSPLPPRPSDPLVVIDRGPLAVLLVVEPPLDGIPQEAEFFAEWRPPRLRQDLDQVVEQGSESAVHLKTSGPILADLTHRQHHVVGPAGRAVDEPKGAVRIVGLAVVQLTPAEAEQQVVDLIQREHCCGRVIDCRMLGGFKPSPLGDGFSVRR